MTAMDVNKCLPPELTVQSVDDILYRIGLSFNSLRDQPKRHKFFNPFIKFSFLSIYLLREVIVISLNEENDLLFKIMGSFCHLMGVRPHISLPLILASIMILSFQIIYFHNHLIGIKETYLEVFRMISGSVPPIRLGLTNENQITRLVKITRICLRGAKLNNHLVCPIFAFVAVFIIYLVECSLFDALVFGIPNALLFLIWVIYFVGTIVDIFFIFFIICFISK